MNFEFGHVNAHKHSTIRLFPTIACWALLLLYMCRQCWGRSKDKLRVSSASRKTLRKMWVAKYLRGSVYGWSAFEQVSVGVEQSERDARDAAEVCDTSSGSHPRFRVPESAQLLFTFKGNDILLKACVELHYVVLLKPLPM